MERREVTKESIWKSYYHSDTYFRYWDMQNQKYQKIVKWILIAIAIIPFFQLFLRGTHLGGLESFLGFTVSVLVIFLFTWQLIEKKSLCIQATSMWMLITQDYKKMFERAQQGEVVYQDEIDAIDARVNFISAPLIHTLPVEDKVLEEAEARTKEYLNLSTNPS